MGKKRRLRVAAPLTTPPFSPMTGASTAFLGKPLFRKPFLATTCPQESGKPPQGPSVLPQPGKGPSLAGPLPPGLLAHLPQSRCAPLTSTLSRAETQASDASQMAVKSWPPSRASTTRPPASVISCLVKWPKPLGTGEGRQRKRLKKKLNSRESKKGEKKKHKRWDKQHKRKWWI